MIVVQIMYTIYRVLSLISEVQLCLKISQGLNDQFVIFCSFDKGEGTLRGLIGRKYISENSSLSVKKCILWTLVSIATDET